MGVNLSGCDLTKPRLSPTPKFYDAKEPKEPSPTNPRTSMVKATVPIALLGRDWTLLDLTDATIVGSLDNDLTGFVAEWAIFPKDYSLPGRILTGANFKKAQLPEIDLSKATADDEEPPPDFSGATMVCAKLHSANLYGALFVGADLRGIKMSGAKLETAKFGGAHLDSDKNGIADLSYADLTNADFSGAYLGTSQTQLNGANFSLRGSPGSSRMRRWPAQFNGAFLVGVNFQNIEGKSLQGANFSGACLANCNFGGTNLLDVNLTGGVPPGHNFKDASLFGANLNNAAIASVKGSLKIIGTLPAEVEYLPTFIETGSTNSKTTCPSSAFGPCSGKAWEGNAKATPMTEWTYKGLSVPTGEP